MTKSAKTAQKPTVVVAGASGFVGQGLAAAFDDEAFDLVGLTRRPPNRAQTQSSGYRWRRCDLFSRKQTFEALADATYGIFLVHSTLPSAHLTQGRPADMDLICADNFARAAAHHGLEQIIYVGPAIGGDDDDPQVQTRREIEATLGGYATATTTLRASMILGPQGVATQILSDLVDRLPLMVLPRWTEVEISPVDRRDLCQLIVDLLGCQKGHGRSFDLRGSGITSFAELLKATARLKEQRRHFVTMPLSVPSLAARWISTFCDVHPAVVDDFVRQTLCGRLTVHGDLPEAVGWQPRGVDEALEYGLGLAKKPDSAPSTALSRVRETQLLRRDDDRKVVRSVQRLHRPTRRDARWVALEYARWLPRFMRPLIRVTCDEEQTLRFFVGPFPWPLLVLEFDRGVSLDDRHLYWIRGGLLAREHRWARLEFREVMQGRWVMAAIHEFEPALPWFLYRLTQAQAHRFVMHYFGKYLRSIDKESR